MVGEYVTSCCLHSAHKLCQITWHSSLLAQLQQHIIVGICCLSQHWVNNCWAKGDGKEGKTPKWWKGDSAKNSTDSTKQATESKSPADNFAFVVIKSVALNQAIIHQLPKICHAAPISQHLTGWWTWD